MSVKNNPHKLLSLLTNVIALTPAVVILFLALSNRYAANPIQWATQRTGDVALILLLVTLALRPLGKMLNWNTVFIFRRIVGWYVVKYALAHLFLFVGIDYRFRLKLLWLDVGGKQFFWIGLASLILLFIVGFATLRRLEGKTAMLRKILSWGIYPAGLLVILHYFLARKGNLLNLQGDILLPLITLGVFFLLILLRIPSIERMISRKAQQKNTPG